MIDSPIPSSKGTYVLVFEAKTEQKVQVGKQGVIDLKPGFYAYIGSAFGPGGLKSRIGRHLKKNKKLKWHIDYVREYLDVVDMYYSESKEKLECKWAAIFAEDAAIPPLKGFGSSDCKCFSHFFYFKDKPTRQYGLCNL
jgi:Uri superfamily endonuclease